MIDRTKGMLAPVGKGRTGKQELDLGTGSSLLYLPMQSPLVAMT